MGDVGDETGRSARSVGSVGVRWRGLGWVALAATTMLLASCGGGTDGAEETSGPASSACEEVDAEWVAAWGASPSGASRGTGVTDQSDASGQPKTTTRDETTRAVLTPTLGGPEARVRLSNRFGASPVTFEHVTIGNRMSGASVAAETITPVTFSGQSSVMVQPGEDVVSDPVDFRVEAFAEIAVSVYVPAEVGLPTEHFTARQTSYLTPEDAGDHAADPGPEAFSETTTTRPFVTGVDVRVTDPTGVVVALGDSITDGYQGQGPSGAPESEEGLDEDGRYPDLLARRLVETGRPSGVVNAGISGNRVLRDGIDGPMGDAGGPAALDRVDDDVLAVPGATTVILMEGINDLGMLPNDEPAEIVAAYERLIARMQGAGLSVLQATLTPSTGGPGAYGTQATDDARDEINEWIRTHSPADWVIDFDAAVRDPEAPERLDPDFDGGDHLHLNLAGNRALADAVPLDRLADPSDPAASCDRAS